MGKGQKPVRRVRSGPVTGAIWRNEGKDGPFFTVTFERAYKDGDTFKNATSYGAKDLPHLIQCGHKAAQAIDTLLIQLQQRGRGGR